MNIIEQNKDKINGKLKTFDRLIINGYLIDLFNFNSLEYFLSQNNILKKDFKEFATAKTEELKKHIEKYIVKNNANLQYLTSAKTNKQDLVDKAMQEFPNKQGLIAAFSELEVCSTITVISNRASKKLELANKSTKCLFYYLYYNDVEFGRMFLKIQTWFPFNVQIYINGHEYLAKKFDKNKIQYQMYNNSFSYISDYAHAQQLADKFLEEKLSKKFNFLVKQINCLLPYIQKTLNNDYYWCIDQCEFATDITFKSKEELDIIFKKLVETTYFTLNSTDIYSFFDRKIKDINRLKKTDIVSDLRNRSQGFRIKFKINRNQIKMYNKGNNLRIEVTINNPKDFKVLKTEKNEENGEVIETKKWQSMGKSVTNLYRYVEISNSITERYINVLPIIDADEVSIAEVTKISSPVIKDNRKYSGFNVLEKDTLKLFQAISSGEYIINGFSNKLLRNVLFKSDITKKEINKLTRLLAKLKAHKIVKKVANKNKYYLTTNGRKTINSIMLYTKRTLLS
jgi:hypothetical protein